MAAAINTAALVARVNDTTVIGIPVDPVHRYSVHRPGMCEADNETLATELQNAVRINPVTQQSIRDTFDRLFNCIIGRIRAAMSPSYHRTLPGVTSHTHQIRLLIGLAYSISMNPTEVFSTTTLIDQFWIHGAHGSNNPNRGAAGAPQRDYVITTNPDAAGIPVAPGTQYGCEDYYNMLVAMAPQPSIINYITNLETYGNNAHAIAFPVAPAARPSRLQQNNYAIANFPRIPADAFDIFLTANLNNYYNSFAPPPPAPVLNIAAPVFVPRGFPPPGPPGTGGKKRKTRKGGKKTKKRRTLRRRKVRRNVH